MDLVLTVTGGWPPIVAGLAWMTGGGLLGASLTYGMIQLASRFGILDEPNARSSHVRPTPRGGGAAIVAVGAMATTALWLAGVPPPAHGGWAAIAAIAVAAVSGIDDVASISHRLRLVVHLAAAGVAVVALGPLRIIDLGPFGSYHIGPAGWGLTILWIVGMTNAFNFMDGIDGIAGITAAVALTVLATGLWAAGAAFGSLTAAALAAATAGFLIWNWQPAQIFMGDVGSAFLGFTIAVLPLTGGEAASRWLLPVTACVMAPFLFDTSFTLLRRVRNRENIFEAHRSHLYQRLVIGGWSHARVAALYGALAALGGAFGLALQAG
jgi:UDP-N-acetylmuramyl pentapeptide phosphotransferase/UDP-N-acetylglucosamine-1-phosphate transferase